MRLTEIQSKEDEFMNILKGELSIDLLKRLLVENQSRVPLLVPDIVYQNDQNLSNMNTWVAVSIVTAGHPIKFGNLGVYTREIFVFGLDTDVTENVLPSQKIILIGLSDKINIELYNLENMKETLIGKLCFSITLREFI